MVFFQIETLTLRLYFQESPPVSSTAIISQRKGKNIISTMVQIKFSIRYVNIIDYWKSLVMKTISRGNICPSNKTAENKTANTAVSNL